MLSYFQSHKGIRQGDPRSSYALIIIAQDLTCILYILTARKDLKLFRYKNMEPINHLMYVDNLLVVRVDDKNY